MRASKGKWVDGERVGRVLGKFVGFDKIYLLDDYLSNISCLYLSMNEQKLFQTLMELIWFWYKMHDTAF